MCCAVAVLALTGASVAGARPAVRPPAGTPDLGRMALGLTDLPSGAMVEHQGYARERGYVAAYKRQFGPTRLGHTRLIALESEVALDKTPDEASETFSGLRLILTDKSFRAALKRELLNAVKGAENIRLRTVSFGKTRTLHIGDGAFVLPMTLRTSRGRIHAALAFGVRDRVETILVAASAPGSPLATTTLAPLIRATAAHIDVELSPITIAPPTVAGVGQQGQTLTAGPGTWKNAPTTFAYQWQRCDAAGAACVAVPGATGQSYVVSATDAGTTLRVAVTATNRVGHTAAVSAQTALTA